MENNKKLYVALKDLWILGEFYRKNQQIQLFEQEAKSFVALGNLEEVKTPKADKSLNPVKELKKVNK